MENGGDAVTVLHTSAGPVRARWVVNAAGLGADHLDRLFGHDRFTVTPPRRTAGLRQAGPPLVNTIVLPVPSSVGKGVLISPTIYGNVMLGPTAEDRLDRADTATSEEGFAFLLGKGNGSCPASSARRSPPPTRGCARPSTTATSSSRPPRTALPPGGRHPLDRADLVHGHRRARTRPARRRRSAAAPPRRPAGTAAHAQPRRSRARPYQDARLIAEDPAYGTVVCFCERVTEGEIRDACRTVLPAPDLDGLRRRTRP
ncbi:FAD-dependent oxidoreductase [Streptomyces sp. M19]